MGEREFKKRFKDMIKIYISERDNQNPEAFVRILKRFKKKVDRNGILREFKQRIYFEKPSDKKRRIWKENARKRRNKKGKRR